MNSTANRKRMPTLFLPHGGGPCFFMEWPGEPHTWDRLGAWLRGVIATLPSRPSAIVVVSAHWETPLASVTARIDPPLLFDYHGFPPETYRLKYPAPGSPELARRIQILLGDAGVASSADAQRGFDHGVFVPFLLVAPEADIPIVALSLVAGLDPAAHIAMGAALAPLRDEGVLIVGSGMSFHNMGALMGQTQARGDRFDAWLGETVRAKPGDRVARLSQWLDAPEARSAHPREEHLLPLMVVAGAAGADPGTTIFQDRIMGTPISAFRFDQSH